MVKKNQFVEPLVVYNLGHILDLIKVNEIKDKTYTISFALEQNLTRRGPILAMGVHCSTLLRTPGADLKRDVIEAIDM